MMGTVNSSGSAPRSSAAYLLLRAGGALHGGASPYIEATDARGAGADRGPIRQASRTPVLSHALNEGHTTTVYKRNDFSSIPSYGRSSPPPSHPA
jgi:hypothetical protein